MDRYPLKRYPIVGACGLNCGLCPRYTTEGESRCPGCCGHGFWYKHPSCGFITCCVKQKGLETCALCADWRECKRIARNLNTTIDSVISYRPLAYNFAFIQKYGIDEFARIETEKVKLLRYLLDNYNEGRSKTFYCTSCQLLPLDKLKQVVAGAQAKITGNLDIKEKAKIVRAAINSLADSLKIDLRLRK